MLKPKQIINFVIGSIFFGLGWVGVIVPGMPATICFILAAIFYMRSSPKMYRKIINNPAFGPSVRLFMEERAISKRGKIISLTSIVVMSSLAIVFIHSIVARISIAVLALVGVIFILTLKTVENGRVKELRAEIAAARAQSGGPNGTNPKV